MICSGDRRSEVGERGSVTYVYYVYEHKNVRDRVCGVEAFDGVGGGELGISGISEMVESSVKRLYQHDWCPLRRISNTYR